MSAEPFEIDENGQWIGTCAECGTNHDGYFPDTFGAKNRCLRAQVHALGAVHLEAELDQLDALVADARDSFLREQGLIPPRAPSTPKDNNT